MQIDEGVNRDYVGKSFVSLLSILNPNPGEKGLPLGKAKIQFHRIVKEGMVMVNTQSGLGLAMKMETQKKDVE